MGFQLNLKKSNEEIIEPNSQLGPNPANTCTYLIFTSIEQVLNYAPNPQYLSNHIYMYLYI
jgi:hypothetical protein